jgi:hypothetical protein
MRNFIIALVILALCALGVSEYMRWKAGVQEVKEDQEEPVSTTTEPLISFEKEGEKWERIVNNELGFTMGYRKEPQGYVVEELSLTQSPDVLYAFSLIDRAAWEELKQSTTPREGPPSITVYVFDNASGMPAEEWVGQNMYANYMEEVAQVHDTTVGNVPAIKYHTTGLYEGEAVVVSYSGRIYLLMGSYFTREDQIARDFEEILQTVEFL